MARSCPRISATLRRLIPVAAVGACSLAGGGNLAAPADASGVRASQTGAADAHPVEVTRNIRYRGHDGPRLDVYRSTGARRRAAGVLVVHGGAWQYGARRRTSGVALALARSGMVAFNVDYTLATPARPGLRRQPDDLRAAVRWIRRHADDFALDPKRLGALGTSAGGNLVGLVATDAEGALDAGTRIRAAVTWSAPLELGRLRRGWLDGAVETFLGCSPWPCAERMAAGSPTSHVSADDPPFLIVNSRSEVVPAAQARTMSDRLTEAGVRNRLRILDGNRHGMEYARGMVAASARFLKRALEPAGR